MMRTVERCLFLALLLALPPMLRAAAPAEAEATPVQAPDSLLNFHAIDAGLLTAGQVTPAHVPALPEAGVELVINLAVADAERNAEEGFLVTSEGIAYAHIPVVWNEPTLADLALFFAVMDARGDRKTLVHCFANYRASAFTYLYRTLRLGVPEAEAREGLMAVWSDEAFEEYPMWVTFMETAKDAYGS